MAQYISAIDAAKVGAIADKAAKDFETAALQIDKITRKYADDNSEALMRKETIDAIRNAASTAEILSQFLANLSDKMAGRLEKLGPRSMIANAAIAVQRGAELL